MTEISESVACDTPSRAVSISLLHEVTDVLRPPRALVVPYKLGFPLGEPNNPALQHRIIAAALSLLARNDVPVIEDFQA